MIPARPGLRAAFRVKSLAKHAQKERTFFVGYDTLELKPGEDIVFMDEIVAWEDDEPLICRNGKLISPKARFSNFVGVDTGPDDTKRVVQMMPASDWRLWFIGDDGQPRSRPLAAWALCADGSMVAATANAGGDVELFDRYDRVDYMILHESEGTPNIERLTQYLELQSSLFGDETEAETPATSPGNVESRA
jgi:hypothetical protein